MSDNRTGRSQKFEHKIEKAVKSLDLSFQMFYEAKNVEGVSKGTIETCQENFRFLSSFLDILQTTAR